MRKTTIILLLVIQVVLLFLFYNLYSMFKGMEDIDLKRIMDPTVVKKRFEDFKNVFSMLSIILGIMMAATGFYLLVHIRKTRVRPVADNMPPLQDFLLELKGSENQLKDIVEKQQVDVTRKRELNKTIVNHINAGVIFVDRASRIEIFNPEASRMFSQSYANAKNNLLGRILCEFPKILNFIEENRERNIQAEILCKDKLFQVHLNPLENIGLLIICKDITEEKKLEEIHNRNRNFVMLGEMAAFLAHEVKNSLGVIYGYTRTFKSEEDRVKIGKVNKEVQHLTGMMESFLCFSKPVKVGAIDEMDPVKLFSDIAGEHGLEVELSVINNEDEEDDSVVLETDAHLLHSVFSNLLLNAGEAGATRVSAVFQQDNGLGITITDNGGGIGEENIEKIWFPFFTTKEKGTGMGLALIRKIISSLDGEITLEKTGPEGTTFKIAFLYP